MFIHGDQSPLSEFNFGSRDEHNTDEDIEKKRTTNVYGRFQFEKNRLLEEDLLGNEAELLDLCLCHLHPSPSSVPPPFQQPSNQLIQHGPIHV